MENNSLKFPKNFLWGTATSSYQVEGGIENNDWTEAGHKGFLPLAGKAVDQYNLYKKDFDLVKFLGQNVHRFSIEWARVEPEEGRFSDKETDHYRQVVNALKIRNIEPVVTLWHFTLPAWFSKIGGFENSKAFFYFSRYCRYIVEQLGDVKFWITINEPTVYTNKGYLQAEWPPFKFAPVVFFNVLKKMVAIHGASYNIIKEGNKNNQIGIAHNIQYFNALPLIKNFWNFYFLNKTINFSDFIGLNYYFRVNPFWPKRLKTDMGWEIFPEGIYRVLKDLQKYQKPIYITENGLADAKDEKRTDFIKKHLFWVHRAIQEKVDIRGYFYWSLLDNFEWDKGFWPRFGLIGVDYQTMERSIRQSAYEYKKICESNSLII